MTRQEGVCQLRSGAPAAQRCNRPNRTWASFQSKSCGDEIRDCSYKTGPVARGVMTKSRRLIEMLLLMAGVEPNPGPDRLYDYWSRDTSRYLWPTIVLMDASMSGRIKRLLKYFDPRTKGGKLVYAGVGATMAASVADLKERYFPTLTGDFTDEHRWDCIKKNLDSLLPAVSALDAEAELKRMIEVATLGCRPVR